MAMVELQYHICGTAKVVGKEKKVGVTYYFSWGIRTFSKYVCNSSL